MNQAHAPKFTKLVEAAKKRYGDSNVIVNVTKLGKGAIVTYSASASHKCGVSIGTVTCYGAETEILQKNSWARIDAYVDRYIHHPNR